MYAFRSKQNYIYRSNRIKEIVGASHLIAKAPEQFLIKLNNNGIDVKDSYDFLFGEYKLPFDSKDGNQIVYIGGGNLYMYYKDRDTYCKANMLFSQMLLGINNKGDEPYPFGLKMHCACADDTGDFESEWKQLHCNGIAEKNCGLTSEPAASLPIVQLDRVTSQPIAFNGNRGQSLECYNKERAYDSFLSPNENGIIDNDDLSFRK